MIHLAALAALAVLAWHAAPASRGALPIVVIATPTPPMIRQLDAARIDQAEPPRLAALTMPSRLVVAAPPHRTAVSAFRPASRAVAPASVRAPAPARTPPPAADDQAALNTLTSRIHAAVQGAAAYPLLARMQHREGRARIRFQYAGGAVDHLAVAESSHSTLLDTAALIAVRHAAMPPAPPELGDHVLTLLVWVDFTLE